MQLCIYFILFTCYGIAKCRVQKFMVGNHVFQNELGDLPVNANDDEPTIETLYQRKSYQIKPLNIVETKTIQNENIKDIRKYLNHAVDKRKKTLQHNVKFYEMYLYNNNLNYSRVVDEYATKLKRYFNRTFYRDDAIYDVDKQFVLFDLAETSNILLYKTQLNVLYNITNNNYTTNEDMKKFYRLLDDLQIEIRDDKKEEIKYICDTFDICRMFPAFSDHISDLLGEVINFSSSKIDDFVTHAKILIMEKVNFFRDFLDDDLINVVGNKLDSIFTAGAPDLRDNLSVLKMVLSKRHKFTIRKNDSRSIIAKALRILIDIVDKAFEKDDDHVFLMYIGLTKQGFRKFSNRGRNIANILSQFIRFTANSLKYNWTPDAKMEVRTLLEVMLRSRVSSDDVYEYLFNKGSQYVNTKRITDFDLI